MKNIMDIVVSLNAVLNRTALADFYERRSRLNNSHRRSGGLLQITRGEAEVLSGYSFHWGGRSELQFNIGFEDDRYFRYGVAFSLQPDRNLPDPVAVLQPKIQRFNAAVPVFPILRGLRMWWYENGSRSTDGDVQSIPLSQIKPRMFFFH